MRNSIAEELKRVLGEKADIPATTARVLMAKDVEVIKLHGLEEYEVAAVCKEEACWFFTRGGNKVYPIQDITALCRRNDKGVLEILQVASEPGDYEIKDIKVNKHVIGAIRDAGIKPVNIAVIGNFAMCRKEELVVSPLGNLTSNKYIVTIEAYKDLVRQSFDNRKQLENLVFEGKSALQERLREIDSDLAKLKKELSEIKGECRSVAKSRNVCFASYKATGSSQDKERSGAFQKQHEELQVQSADTEAAIKSLERKRIGLIAQARITEPDEIVEDKSLGVTDLDQHQNDEILKHERKEKLEGEIFKAESDLKGLKKPKDIRCKRSEIKDLKIELRNLGAFEN